MEVEKLCIQDHLLPSIVKVIILFWMLILFCVLLLKISAEFDSPRNLVQVMSAKETLFCLHRRFIRSN